MKNILEKIKNNLPDEVSWIYILAGVVFITTLGLGIFFGWQYFSGKDFGMSIIQIPDGQDEEEKKECKHRRILDGVCVFHEDDTNPNLVTIMIENHPEARPQSGLVDASVVYEVPVEGNYSRFMAIYPADAKVNQAGPVRSARPYYLDWLQEYPDTTMYMHCGGSPEALEIINDSDIFDLNEFYRGWYYWRSENRSAPHNIYTSSKLWDKAIDDYLEVDKVDGVDSWNFREYDEGCDFTDVSQPCASEISVDFSSPIFHAYWEYNSSTRKYERYQGKYLHKDLDGRKIEADNVIVQYVDSKVIDEIGRLKINTTGSGEAIIFRDGYFEKGEWRKEDETSRTKFYNFDGENGQEVELKPGKIWIEVVNQISEVKYE